MLSRLVAHIPERLSANHAAPPTLQRQAVPWGPAEHVGDGACACGGGCPRCAGASLMPKLEMSQPEDPLGQEADRAADAEMSPRGAAGSVRASSRTLVQRQTSGPSLRSPSLEVGLVRGQGAFAIGSSPLSSTEAADALAVFESSIDLSRVRMVYSPLLSAPTTLGDTIRVPPGYTMPRRVLIHELAHVWQYQTKGSGYISDSAFHQVAGMLAGSRHLAGNYTLEAGKSIHSYHAEQQAVIIDNYFTYPWLQSDPIMQKLISEVRASRPLIGGQVVFEETAAGLPPRQWPLATEREGGFFGTGVPQLELRF